MGEIMFNNENMKTGENNLDKEFFGQPKGVGLTSSLASGTGFVSYGFSAILIYYLYAPVREGLGFSEVQAAQFLSLYFSLSFMAGVVGAYVADRLLGVRKAMRIGYLIKAIGHLLLAIPGGGIPMYLSSMVLLLLASLTMGNSLYASVGLMYGDKDLRRDTGYSWMYIMNNVGAIAPFLTGYIAQQYNYNAGFAVVAIVSILMWVGYISMEKKYLASIPDVPSDPIPKDKKAKSIAILIGSFIGVLMLVFFLVYKKVISIDFFVNSISTVSVFVPFVYMAYIFSSSKVTADEKKKALPFIILFIANAFAMMIFYQSTTIVAIYIKESVNLNIGGFSIPPAWFQTLNAIMAVVFGIFFSYLWSSMEKKQPSTVNKFGIGTLLYALSPLVMVIPFMIYGDGELASPFWPILFYAVMTFGEAITSPVGFSLASQVAPAAFIAQMTTVWQLSQSTGSGLSALVANLYVPGNETNYFLFIGGITLVVFFVIFFMRNKLNKIME